ncbi:MULTISPECIES: phosphoenolpyruvate--protein phosphotransferase [Cysteiniphilum]|uniref:phosphoenolpyruvate--protein phosphotransferase n=1 Tax=Cysteiniphilum litorale TaxID=2056700 RepID=A0A8J2Z5Z0_9GAMM|nr:MULTISPECIES: phosphoenolpyruvate--protein phosphotransferase [Cysteiniphilum]GGG04320.1 phosphoenolpyruvate--protein phosphotransferase [Cysteiniphilum litorale]
MGLTLYAPVNGFIVELDQVPDPVFAQKMVGNGFAIEPLDQNIYSPVTGIVKNIAKTKHAITIATESGYDVLIHLGLESVTLNGEGIDVHVSLNDQVDINTLLLSFDLSTISKKIKSLITPVIITDYQEDDLLLKVKGRCSAQTPIISLDSTVHNDSNKPVLKTQDQIFVTRSIIINNPHGLHARPAALLAHTLKSFDATAIIYKNDSSADVKSLVALMGLNIQLNDKITLTVSGEDAEKAACALEEALVNFVDDHIAEAQPTKSELNQTKVNGNQYLGISAAKGIVIGELRRINEESFNYADEANVPEAQELERFTLAKEKHEKQLSAQMTTHAHDKTKHAMLGAHIALLNDANINSSVIKFLAQGKTAEYAWDHAILESITILEKTQNTLLQERVADLKDIRKQVLYILTNGTPTKTHYSKPTILIADEFTLSDILEADQNVVGFISTKGGRTSHVAIIANNNNLPLLIQVDSSLFNHCAQYVILNATDGYALINPDFDTMTQYQAKIATLNDALALMRAKATEPAKTKDDHTIHCYMNIKSAEGCLNFAQSGAEGVGLFRSEFIFYDRLSAPTEDEQLSIYNEVLDATNDTPIIIRTLDAGGDKQIDYLNMPHEMNPFLGVRGIRLCLKHPEILRTQLRAIIRTQNANAHIMLPMITNIAEFRQVKAIYEEERLKLGISIKQPLGIMVEVPSVIFQAELFAKEVDFMSIGTNDLTQYLLAMDREHDALAAEIDHLHPAVIHAINKVNIAAQKHNTKLSICGLMAADQEALAILIGLGIKHLSMRSNMLAENKALIRRLKLTDCQQLAQQALTLESAEAVRILVRQQISFNEGGN